MLSEIDLKDWIRSEEPIELYKVQRDSVVSLQGNDVFYFHCIDGMYSYCTTLAGNVFHLSASAPVYVFSKKEKT